MKKLIMAVVILLSIPVGAVTLRSLGPNNPSNIEVPSAAITYATTAAMYSAPASILQFGDEAIPQDTLLTYKWYGTYWAQEFVLPRYTFTSTITPTQTPTITPTPANTSLPNPPIIPTITPTVTGTLPATSTPVISPTQTPAPSVVTEHYWIGDSWTAGNHATTITNCFAYLTDVQLNVWYPTTTNINVGSSGVPSPNFLGFAIYTYAHGAAPNSKLNIELGINDLGLPVGYVSGGVTCNSCCYGVPLSQGVGFSYVYQSNIQNLLKVWFFYNPGTQVTLMTIPDVSCLGGDCISSFDPQLWTDYVAILASWNQRIWEIAQSQSNVRVIDLNKVMYGHPEYYDAGSQHPNDAGHAAISRAAIAQYSSPPR